MQRVDHTQRRQILIGLGTASLGAAAFVRPASAADEEMVEFLFVQTAERASLADSVLELTGIGPSTLYFSDRPERIVGHVPTERFVGKDSEVYDSFKADPPNATLTVVTDDRTLEVAVVVLLEPKLEGSKLVFPVEVLEGEPPLEGGHASLFIDMIGRPMSPTSVAGVHRRHRRRRRHEALD